MSNTSRLILDNRTTGDWLDYFYRYCQQIPYVQGTFDPIELVPNPALESYDLTTTRADEDWSPNTDTEGAKVAELFESNHSVRIKMKDNNSASDFYLPNAPEYYDRVITFTSKATYRATIHDGENNWPISQNEELTFRYMAGAWSPNQELSWADVFFDSVYNDDEAREQPQDKRLNVENLTALADNLDTADGTLAPIQAFLLAFLEMQKTPRALFNSLAPRHRQLYYQDLLGLAPNPVQADNVMVSFTLQEDIPELYLPQGTLLDAGTDSEGNERQYKLEQGLLVNQVHWTDLRWTDYSDPANTTACIAFDESAEVSWPEGGVRLFDSSMGVATLPGRVVSSSLLALAGGTRTIIVTFAENIDGLNVTGYVSGASAWLTLASPSISGTTCTFTIDASIAAIEANLGLDGFTETEPLLKIVSNNPENVIPEIASIATSVVNMPNVFMSTDDGSEDINKPVEPFGLEPMVGTRVNFVAEEWLGKGSISITLTPSWMGLPEESFPAYYANYTSAGNITNDNVFKVSAAMSENGIIGDQLNGSPVNLFADNNTNTTAPSANPLTIDGVTLTGDVVESEDPRDWSSWLTLTLTPQDFLHNEYEKIIVTPDHDEVNPPYTPQWQQCQVDVDYGLDDAPVQHLLTPFGYTNTADDVNTAGQQLYLGFTDIIAGQDLLLHWQLKSPSEPTVAWHYLNQDNQWESLDAFCYDQTDQLFHSGLWSVTLPDDASIAPSEEASNAWCMPSGRVWLRASVVTVPDEVDEVVTTPWLYGINTNCGTAIRIINPDSVYDGALPANTITQTTDVITEVDSVTQPWESVGGRDAETSLEFNDRVSKQLSHRNRAFNWREIRDILLSTFPELMDARNESASDLGASFSYEAANPNMTVLPKAGQQDNDDLLRPKFNQARLTKMQDYILARSTPWMQLVLNNPDYRDVDVSYGLTFSPGVNNAYGNQQVKEALEKQYMPWAWDETSQLSVGVALDYYDMVSFIQQLDYVESVDRLTLGDSTSSVPAESNQVLILKIV